MIFRSIVRDDDILDGEWRFDGTLIAIRNLRRDIERGGMRAYDAYRSMGLSDDEIQAALTFAFPVIEQPAVEAPFMAIAIRCACGVHRQTTVSAPTYETDPCICGRRWRIAMAIEEAPNGDVPTYVGNS
jgi:uncharacterized protein (DUF433 family)